MYVWDTSLTTRGERPRGTRLNLKRIIIYAMTTKTIDVISTEPGTSRPNRDALVPAGCTEGD